MQIPGEHGRTWPVKCNTTSVARNENQIRKRRRREEQGKRGREEGRKEGGRRSFCAVSSKVRAWASTPRNTRHHVWSLHSRGIPSEFRDVRGRSQLFPADIARGNFLSGAERTVGEGRTSAELPWTESPRPRAVVFTAVRIPRARTGKNTFSERVGHSRKKFPVWRYPNAWESCDEIISVNKPKW